MSKRIERGSLVAVEIELRDEDGEPIETDVESPLRYRHGAGELLPAVEEVLAGARAGDERSVTIPPEGAFGDHDPEGVFVVPRDALPDDVELDPGIWITMVVQGDENDDEGEGEIEARVVEVADEAVVLDANHPLAGRTLTVRARVVSVEEPLS